MKKIMVGLSVIAVVLMFAGCDKIGGGGGSEAVSELKEEIDDLQAQIDDLNDMLTDLQEQFDEHLEKSHKSSAGKPSTGNYGKGRGGGKIKPATGK